MFLSDLTINRPVGAIMVTIALIIFGLISYNQLGVEDNPDIEFPFVSVQTVYRGADPETVETEVTELIEDEIATISGIKNIYSISSENVSFIFIEFELEVEVDVAAQDVRDAVSRIQMGLPENAETPLVTKLDVMSEPVLEIAVGGDVEPQDLARYVLDNIKPRIDSVDGVGSVNVYGLREREVRIWVDKDRMAAHDISAQEIVAAIQTGHIEIPGGRIETGEREYTVVTSGELQSVAEFEDLIVATRNDSAIRLRDVATVEDGLEDLRSQARLNGQPAIGLGIIKKSGANTVEVADDVYEIIEEIRASAPPGISISVPKDNSVYTRDSLKEVQGHLYGGGLIAVIIVLLFLGSFRTTLIAAISIPTSIITTYIFINAFGFTLNNITMLGFTLMVGMLIDDAIVVLENIYRHTEMGKGPMQAAKEGAKEISFAVLSTTLTILAVFVPIAFMSGIVGRFMYQYGITVAVGSIASYFVAVSLGPMLASRFMKKGGIKDRFILFTWFDTGFEYVERGYRSLIALALKRKGITLLIAFIAAITSLGLFAVSKKEFFSDFDRSSTAINIEMPVGSSLPALIEFAEPIEEMVMEIPEVENIFTTLGGGSFGSQNEGEIYIDLVEKTERDRSVWEINDEIRENLEGLAGAKILVGTAGGFGSSYEFAMVVTGTNMDDVRELANRFEEEMESDPMFTEVDTDYRAGKPEVRLSIDRERAADLGVNIATIGSTLRLLVSGDDIVSTFSQEGNEYDVRLRLEESYRDYPEDLENLIVYNFENDPVPVSSFANVVISSGAAEIRHTNKLKSIEVQANLSEDYTVGDASIWAEERFRTMVPPGMNAEIYGEAEIMNESFESMGFALILGIVLIYVVLASQFNHFVHPLTIMTSLPLSFVGAFGLLFLTNMTVNVFSLIGIIMLMGLVTKNAILVVEFTNQLRERGMDREEALLTAGPIRLRPVAMTALSTIGGMLPVALMIGGGAGVELRAPMAVAVIGGLLTSTLLTLVVVPVVYALFDVWSERLVKRFSRKEEAAKERIIPPRDQVN